LLALTKGGSAKFIAAKVTDDRHTPKGQLNYKLLGYEPTPNRWTTAQKVEIYFPPARTKKALKLHKFQ
jgi:hypothetical protein